MSAVELVAARGAYPERAEASGGAVDNLLANLGWRVQRNFRRRLDDPPTFPDSVRQHATRMADKPLLPRIPALRYRLRRDGFLSDHVAECFGLYNAAVVLLGGDPPSPEVLGAARQLIRGGIVDHADPEGRTEALAYAAAALAICGVRVHLVAANEARARSSETRLRASFGALGLGIACVGAGMSPSDRDRAFRALVVCATHREIAVAYLQDRLQMAGRPRLLLRALATDDERASRQIQLTLDGLHFALVEEADLVMLDDAYAPVTISAEVDQAQERLLYEQTLELARACEPGSDFTFDQQGMRLTATGSERLARLVAPLGGIWGAQQRREELVSIALFAVHGCERGVDYQVSQGRVVFPKSDPVEGGAEEPDPALLKLVELKEGCRLAGAKEVLARISVPRFFRRYLNLAGICADGRGLEKDFWVLYGLKTTRIGRPLERVACRARVFCSVEAKRDAVLAAAREHAASGAVVVAVRTPREVQALMAAMESAGISAGLLRGTMDETEQAAVANLDSVGSVAVTLFTAEIGVTRAHRSEAPLHLIVAELHDATRHVSGIRRAYGANSCEMMLSLDEEAIAAGTGRLAAGITRFSGATGDELPARQARWIAGLAQREVENVRALMRRDLIMRDDYMSTLLAFSGSAE